MTAKIRRTVRMMSRSIVEKGSWKMDAGWMKNRKTSSAAEKSGIKNNGRRRRNNIRFKKDNEKSNASDQQIA